MLSPSVKEAVRVGDRVRAARELTELAGRVDPATAALADAAGTRDAATHL